MGGVKFFKAFSQTTKVKIHQTCPEQGLLVQMSATHIHIWTTSCPAVEESSNRDPGASFPLINSRAELWGRGLRESGIWGAEIFHRCCCVSKETRIFRILSGKGCLFSKAHSLKSDSPRGQVKTMLAGVG